MVRRAFKSFFIHKQKEVFTSLTEVILMNQGKIQYKRLKLGMENKIYFANINSCIFAFLEEKKDRTL